MLSDKPAAPTTKDPDMHGLNAPYGARCFLTEFYEALNKIEWKGLNAPFGARRFLTGYKHADVAHGRQSGLNAPYGARCFLTHKRQRW